MQRTRMVRLIEASSPFHARVVAARLGAEGIVTELRGNIDGPYPVGRAYVYVGEDDLADAQELLLADEVESAFEGPSEPLASGARRELWVIAAVVLVMAFVALSRSAVGA